MIAKQYFDGLFNIIPLMYAADLSQTSLVQALVQHKFNLNDKKEYLLVLGRENIVDICKIAAGYNIFNIKVELQEVLRDEWYLVNNDTKTIVYSPGA